MEYLKTKLQGKIKDANNTESIKDSRKYVLLEDVKLLLLDARLDGMKEGNKHFNKISA